MLDAGLLLTASQLSHRSASSVTTMMLCPTPPVRVAFPRQTGDLDVLFVGKSHVDGFGDVGIVSSSANFTVGPQRADVA